MLKTTSIEALNKVLSTQSTSITIFSSNIDSHKNQFKQLNLEPSMFATVRQNCEFVDRVVTQFQNEDLGNELGFTLIRISSHFRGWEQSIPKMKGWGITNEHWNEIRRYVEKGYHPPTCKSLIDRGLCSKTESCSNKRGHIGGVFLNPSPLLYANPDYVNLVNNNVEGIDLSPSIPTSLKVHTVESAVRRNGSFYLQGKTLVVFNGEKLFIIATPDDLQGSFSYYYEFYRVTLNKDGEPSFKYFLPDRSLLNVLISRLRETQLKQVSFFSYQPVLVKDGEKFKIIKSGFDLRTGTLVVPQDEIQVTYEESLAVLNLLIDSFKFRSKSDRANFVAAMLTPYLSNLFPGMVPLIHIEGNQKGLGKTAAGNTIGYIYLGEYPVSLGLSDNEAETEKQICSGLKVGKYIYLFDNVKQCRTLPLLGGPTLERFVTTKVLRFRLLGGNDIFEVENHLVLIVTTNGIGVSEDILSRRMLIEMYSEGDSSSIQFPIQDLDEFLSSNLHVIRYALVGMIEKWISLGSVLGLSKHRFRNWSMVIDGILKANGVEGFLDNQAENKSSSKISREFEKYLTLLPKEERLTAKMIYDKIHSKSPEFSSVEGVAAFAKKIISPLIGERFISLGREYVFEKCGVTSDKTTLYHLKLIEAQEQEENTNVLPLQTKSFN